MKKIRIILLIFVISIVSFSNDSVNETDEAVNTFFKTIEDLQVKQEELKEIKEEVDNQKVLNTLSVASGSGAAAKSIATTFNYYKSTMYQVFSKPNFTTTIELNSDEEVLYIGGGNTENWLIDTTNGGDKNATYVFIKPLFENQKTNINILTNKRTYFFQIESTKSKYNPYINFKYPFEANLNFVKKNTTNLNDFSLINDLDNPKFAELYFNYSYDHKQNFSPIQIFDDGEKTILVFDTKLQELPVPYGYDSTNKLNLINYRVVDNKIIIDKVVKRIDLILNTKVLKIYRK